MGEEYSRDNDSNQCGNHGKCCDRPLTAFLLHVCQNLLLPALRQGESLHEAFG